MSRFYLNSVLCMHIEKGLNCRMCADQTAIAHLIFDLFSQCALLWCSASDISIISQDTLTQGFPSLSLPFLSLKCVWTVSVIPEERKGEDGHQRRSLQDVHDGPSSCQGEQREGGGDPLLLMLTSMCTEWGITGGGVCLLWGETWERSRQVSLHVYQLQTTGISQTLEISHRCPHTHLQYYQTPLRGALHL